MQHVCAAGSSPAENQIFFVLFFVLACFYLFIYFFIYYFVFAKSLRQGPVEVLPCQAMPKACAKAQPKFNAKSLRQGSIIEGSDHLKPKVGFYRRLRSVLCSICVFFYTSYQTSNCHFYEKQLSHTHATKDRS